MVFLQNGFLEDYLESKGLADNTQALIYFAVSKKGETPIDGITDLSPDGLTVTTGKWGDVVAERIQACGMKCGVVDAATYRKAMFEKLMWICAFMLVGTVNGGITVGEVVGKKTEEVVDLILEMGDAITESTGVEFDDRCAARLCSYAQAVAHFPTAIKEFEWRNGFFWDLSEEAEDEELPDPCPTHTAYCNQGVVEDLFSF
uniref:Uncharacterized protein n=1 Tax=Florenciella parvula TaxID=236787 RepID=A0A7S2B9P5_9STRA